MALGKIGSVALLPLVSFAVMAGGGFALWSHLESTRSDLLESDCHVAADQVSHRLTAWIDDRVSILGCLVDACGDSADNIMLSFPRDAQAFVKRWPGFQALNWVDADRVIRITVPARGNEAALGQRLDKHDRPDVRQTIERAASSRTAARTLSDISFYQGGQGFVAYWPVFAANGRLIGFVNGVFPVAPLAEQSLEGQGLPERFQFEIREADGTLVYASHPHASDPWPLQVESRLMAIDRPWTVRLGPTPQAFAEHHQQANKTLLAGILAVALLSSLLLGCIVRRHRRVRADEARVRSLLAATAEGMFGVDLRGDCTFINPSGLELLGYERPEEVLGKNMHSLIHHSHEDGTPYPVQDCSVFQAFLRGEGTHAEECLWRKNGTSFPAEYRSQPVHDGGELVGGVVTFHDTTQRKQAQRKNEELQAQFQQAQKMESLGLLAGGIAHDFNNLLVGIRGNAEMARDEAGNDPGLAHYLDSVIVSANRASDLTRQLLAYSGRSTLAPEPTDMEALIQEMRDLLQVTLGENVTLRCDFEPDLPHVEVDATQIRQVIMNLITNASDAIGDQRGKIQIVVRSFEGQPRGLAGAMAAENLPEGHYVQIQVQDDGCGMSEKTLAKIFDPFFTTKEHGRGLGLSACLGIVSSHHGSLGIESRTGSGTTFRVLLPASSRRSLPAQAEESPAVTPGRGTLLVVDDEPLVQDVARRMLTRLGFAVVTALSGREAVRMFRQLSHELDGVLMDVSMPEMDGIEAAAQMERINPSIPITLMSAFDREESLANVGELEIAGFLSKPFSTRELLVALAKVPARDAG